MAETTITDIAHKALATPADLTDAEVVRLAAWHIDHDEHITAFQRDTARGSARTSPAVDATDRVPGSASLADRLAQQRPQPTAAMLPLPEQQHADPAEHQS